MPISQTALIVAMLRGRQSALPQPLCQDPYALALAGARLTARDTLMAVGDVKPGMVFASFK